MRCLPVAVLIAHSLFFAFAVLGGDRCAHCGGQGCEQVCRLVREDKKVSLTCLGSKCEDFCSPGKSCRQDQHCEEVCDECDGKILVAPKKFLWSDWVPGGAQHVYTKKKLMKKTVEKKIPSYKWVIEDLCPACQAKCGSAPMEPGVPILQQPSKLPATHITAEKR